MKKYDSTNFFRTFFGVDNYVADESPQITFIVKKENFDKDTLLNITTQLEKSGRKIESKTYLNTKVASNDDLLRIIEKQKLWLDLSIFSIVIAHPFDYYTISIFGDHRVTFGHYNEYLELAQIIADNVKFVVGFDWTGNVSTQRVSMTDKLIHFYKNPIENFPEGIFSCYLHVMFWGNDLINTEEKEKIIKSPALRHFLTKNGVGLAYTLPGKVSHSMFDDLRDYFSKNFP